MPVKVDENRKMEPIHAEVAWQYVQGLVGQTTVVKIVNPRNEKDPFPSVISLRGKVEVGLNSVSEKQARIVVDDDTFVYFDRWDIGAIVTRRESDGLPCLFLMFDTPISAQAGAHGGATGT